MASQAEKICLRGLVRILKALERLFLEGLRMQACNTWAEKQDQAPGMNLGPSVVQIQEVTLRRRAGQMLLDCEVESVELIVKE